MTGTPSNASLWANADVYISSNLAEPNPATASTAFGGGWTLVGLLDGGAGFDTEAAYGTVKDYFAWGGALVATARQNFKLVRKFTVLEDNAVTRSLIWPGSTSSQIIIPVPANIKIAFELRTGGKVKRLISRNYAQVDTDGKFNEGETDLAKVPLSATIFPDGSGVLFDQQSTPTISSLALSPLTLSLSLAATNIKKTVATATYSDATTGDVSLAPSTQWFSSDVTKATVVDGYVTGVATGTANITAVYGGVTSTAPCVVTVAA